MADLEQYNSLKERLETYYDATLDMLMDYLPRKEPRRHLYDLVPNYPLRPGKGFRPGLCIATCKAFSGDMQLALRSAVALELFHNAFLVHDDIEDGSLYRRGAPTLYMQHGLGVALNVGDAMQVLSIRPLMDNLAILGIGLTWRVFAEIEHMVRQSAEGQAMELGWVRDNKCDLTDDDYIHMTLKKTCWYTCIHPCRIGALIGTDGTADLDRFNRFGCFMGTAFQIQDDILNLVGEHAKYGKEIGGDIWEGKRTLILVHLLNSCNDWERDRLSCFLATPRRDRRMQDVKWVYWLMAKYGSIEYARGCSRQLAGAALQEFHNAYADVPDSEDKALLLDIVMYMIERDL